MMFLDRKESFQRWETDSKWQIFVSLMFKCQVRKVSVPVIGPRYARVLYNLRQTQIAAVGLNCRVR